MSEHYSPTKKSIFDLPQTFWRKVEMGKMLVAFMRQDMINKIAPKLWKIKGLSEESAAIWKKITSNSEFLLSNQKGEEFLFHEGKSLLAVFVINGKIYIENLKLINYQKVLGNIVNAWALGSQIFEIDGKNQLQVLHFTYKNGRPVVRYGYSAEFSESILTVDVNTKKLFKDFKEFSPKNNKYPTSFTFENIDYIPAEIIPNNYKLLGDIETLHAYFMINEIDRQSNRLPEEFDLALNHVLIADILGSDKSAKQWKERFEEYNFHTVTTNDAQYIEQFRALATDKQAVLNLESSLNWFIDKLEKYTGHLRDTTGTGTNKFNNEVLMFNQIALEMLVTKVNVRNEYFTRFVKRVFEFMNNNALANQPIDNIEVEVQISDIEQIKIDTLKAQAENLKTIKTDKNNKEGKTNESNE